MIGCSACINWAVGLSYKASLDGLSHMYAALAHTWWWMLDYLPATGAAGLTTMRPCDDCSPCAVQAVHLNTLTCYSQDKFDMATLFVALRLMLCVLMIKQQRLMKSTDWHRLMFLCFLTA